jgi:uncharacterized membrane protein
MTRIILVRRSVLKAVIYRVLIMLMDFTTIYLFTKKVHVAIGFMIVSNLYTTLTYLGHERLWANIKWGVREMP